jgi:phosphoribosylglycinamide formyltransferase 2
MEAVDYQGVDEALAVAGVEVRIFSKPNAHVYRRMGVALARGNSIAQARSKARAAASDVSLHSLNHESPLQT